MPSITGYTAEKSQDIQDSCIVSGSVVGGHLILTRFDGGTIDAGDIRGGEQIPHAKVQTVTSAFAATTSSSFVNFGVSCAVSGFVKYRADTKLIIAAHTGVFNSGVGEFYEVGVLVGGTTSILFNGYGPDSSKSGVIEIPGLSAGTYTLTLKKRRAVGGAGNVYDGYVGAKNSLHVTETF